MWAVDAAAGLFVNPHPEVLAEDVGADLDASGKLLNADKVGWLPHVLSGAVKAGKVSEPISDFVLNAKNFLALQEAEVGFLGDSVLGLPSARVPAFVRDLLLMPSGAMCGGGDLEDTVLGEIAAQLQKDRTVNKAAHLAMVRAPTPQPRDF